MEPNIISRSRASSFVPPTLRTSGSQLDLPLELTVSCYLSENSVITINALNSLQTLGNADIVQVKQKFGSPSIAII